MQVSLSTTRGLERRLEVTVPAAKLQGAVDERLKQLSRTARIKGFRPGKVPLTVVRSQYGAQAEADAVNDLVKQSYADAVREQQLRPAGGPKIEALQVAAGADFRYAATFEVLPEIRLKPLAELTLERPTASVNDADVEAMLDNMRRQRPVFTEVDRAAQATDRAYIDYEGRIDGEIFPGGKGEGLKAILGGNNVLKELDAALHGMSVGETKAVLARFPEDYRATNVAGKEAQFDITLRKVEAQSLPELDEQFIRSYGVAEGGIEEFRAKVRTGMEQELSAAMARRQRQNLMDALYQANPLELPQVMVDGQVQELQLQMLRRLGVQKIDQLPPVEPYLEPARKRVTLGLLIGELARGQNLKIERERVMQRLNALVSEHPNPEEVRRQYLGSREAMEQLESAALEDQVIDWALSQVQFTDKHSSFGELTGFGQNAAG